MCPHILILYSKIDLYYYIILNNKNTKYISQYSDYNEIKDTNFL